MKRMMVREPTPIPPFNEPARDLRILNKPLWLMQRDLMARHCKGMLEVDGLHEMPDHLDEEFLVCKDNLYFNAALIDTFVAAARATGRACQIAFTLEDKAIVNHALPLQESIQRAGDCYVADLYYYPPGKPEQPMPLVIDTEAYEMGYYHIPSYLAPQGGELIFQVPNRVFLSIENWVHVYIANTPMGVFNWARQSDEQMQLASLRRVHHWTAKDRKALFPKLDFAFNALLERLNPFEEPWRNHFLASRKLVKVGKNCSIDPTAVIHGPTVLGDNVYVGPGAVITNSLIGNNVNIMQGSQIMLSVISDRCFIPFNAGVFMSSMMENSMIAQNTTLQLCVVGRNTFIGANNVFTDFHLLTEPIRTVHRNQLVQVGMPVLGSAIGHNCRIGSGFVFYPGRMIGSNTVLVLNSHVVNLIRKNVNVIGTSPETNIPGLEGDGGEDGGQLSLYYWPYLVDPESGALRDPQTGEVIKEGSSKRPDQLGQQITDTAIENHTRHHQPKDGNLSGNTVTEVDTTSRSADGIEQQAEPQQQELHVGG